MLRQIALGGRSTAAQLRRLICSQHLYYLFVCNGIYFTCSVFIYTLLQLVLGGDIMIWISFCYQKSIKFYLYLGKDAGAKRTQL